MTRILLTISAALLCTTTHAQGPAPKTIAEVSSVAKPLAMRDLQTSRSFPQFSDEITTVNIQTQIQMPTIITRAQWGAKETSGPLSKHFPRAITIHHGGDKLHTPGTDAVPGIRALQKYSQEQKNWCDIPYHYMIDGEGKIYEARPWQIPGDTNTAYNPDKHLLIEMIGNYEDQAPTLSQIKAVSDLCAWCCDYFNIDPKTIAGHQDYVPTQCPGQYFYPYVISGYIEGQVRQRLKSAYNKNQ